MKKLTLPPIKSKHIYYVIAFLSGGSLLSFESFSVRLIAPYFGHSFYVWAAIIGTTMLGLSLGYYFSGKWFSKGANMSGLLTKALIILMLGIFPGVYLAQFIFSCFDGMGIIPGILVTTIVYNLPIFSLFGFISPTLIILFEAGNQENEAIQIGNTSGKIYALSTFGGVFWILITSFYLIPTVGLHLTALFLALLLLIAAILFFILQKKKLTPFNKREDIETDLTSIQESKVNLKEVILILAFLEGFFFLMFEFIGVQLLQPYYGKSFYIWVTMVAVIMVSSSLGYYFGSFLTKITNQDSMVRILFGNVLVITIWLILYNVIHETIFSITYNWETMVALIFHCFFTTGIPVVLVTSFSPVIIKWLAQKMTYQRSAPSVVLVVSTMGGLVAVYLLAFAVFPETELLDVILYASIFLVLSISVILATIRKVMYVTVLVLISGTLIFLNVNSREAKYTGVGTKVVTRSHGILGELEIRDVYIEYKDRITGQRGVRLERQLTANRKIQSALLMDRNKELTAVPAMEYPFYITTYVSGYPLHSKVLLAGLGGGLMVTQLTDLGFAVDVVEIDKRYYTLDTTYMGLDKQFRFVEDDVRHFINYSDKRYDVIILDLSKSESIPTNVYTLEAFKRLKELLNPNGVLFLNYFNGSSDLSQKGKYSIIKTLELSGYFVGKIRKPEGKNTSEEIIVASMMPGVLPPMKLRMPDMVFDNLGLFKSDYVDSYDKDRVTKTGELLTDNGSVLERMQLEFILESRKFGRLQEYKIFFADKQRIKRENRQFERLLQSVE